MALNIFITGTDTDIGKTVISSFVADYFRSQGIDCGYLKLVSCGGEACGDCRYVQDHAKVAVQNVYHFPLPASPHLAAEQAGAKIEASILDGAMAAMAEQHEIVLVEGAGGLMVPLTRSLLLGDYMAGHDVQTLVVARSGLGTLNHTLLTLEGIRQRNLNPFGIIFNDEKNYGAEDLLVVDNQRVIEEASGVPVLGRMSRFESWTSGKNGFESIGKALLACLNAAPR